MERKYVCGLGERGEPDWRRRYRAAAVATGWQGVPRRAGLGMFVSGHADPCARELLGMMTKTEPTTFV
jgi:hypothetical protein